MKIKSKIIAIAATLGLLTSSVVVYATVVPQEWKNSLEYKICNFLGIEQDKDNSYLENVQDATLDNILSSDKENRELYAVLLDPDTYNIGDANKGILIESNYNQYNLNESNELLEKYSQPIITKLAQVNYTCLEELENKNTKIDENTGEVLEKKESSLEEILAYQSNELKNNWKNYYYNEAEFIDTLKFEITGMLIMNGNNKNLEAYNNYSRAKKIKVTFNNKEEFIINLKDSMDGQFIEMSYIQEDISKPIEAKIEILEDYKGNLSNDIYIADIQFGINSNIPVGR